SAESIDCRVAPSSPTTSGPGRPWSLPACGRTGRRSSTRSTTSTGGMRGSWRSWPHWAPTSVGPDVFWRGATAAILIVLLLAPAVLAQEESPETIRAKTVEIIPQDGAEVVVDGRRYSGRIRVSGHGSGIAVIETVSLDSYLAGIQEVPFSWEPAALQAQAIAARTYLAWNLARGRTESGRAYDYDICATDACQVYAGVEPVRSENGDRWLDAVRSTDSQILLYDGEPALTYYSSTSGGRTRTVSDVWPD